MEIIKPGEIRVLRIYHDDWCNKLKGGECNCNPETELTGPLSSQEEFVDEMTRPHNPKGEC